MPDEKEKVDKLVRDLSVGDKLVIKKGKKPHPISEHIKTMETELVVKDIKSTYVTLEYRANKEFAEENEGRATEELAFSNVFLKDYFKKKDK